MSEASALQFVDTNVLIYAHDLSAGDKHLQSKALLKQLWETRAGCLSVQVLQEFYVNVTHKVAKPLTTEAAARIIADLSAWVIHRPGAEDVLNAIQTQNRYQLSFWDAMIVVSAQQLGCPTLWSEDLTPGCIYAGVTVHNPFS